MSSVKDKALLDLAVMKENLRKMMNPKVLKHFADFLQATGEDDSSMLSRYKWFIENSENSEDCKYAKLAKEFFLTDQAKDVAKAISWLYHNWAIKYE